MQVRVTKLIRSPEILPSKCMSFKCYTIKMVYYPTPQTGTIGFVIVRRQEWLWSVNERTKVRVIDSN